MEVLDEAVSGAGGPTHLAVLGDNSALLIAHVSEAAQALDISDGSTGKNKAIFLLYPLTPTPVDSYALLLSPNTRSSLLTPLLPILVKTLPISTRY